MAFRTQKLKEILSLLAGRSTHASEARVPNNCHVSLSILEVVIDGAGAGIIHGYLFTT